MTAYARQEQDTPWGVFTWELRSVNHRYLEISPRLPEDLRGLEAAVRERIQATLGRGKVECVLRYRPAADVSAELVLNRPLIEALETAMKELEQALPVSAAVSPLDLLRWPGVVEAAQLDLEQVSAAALAALDAALEDLVATRRREGEKLKSLIEQRCGGIETAVAQARERLPEVRARLREKLHARLEEVRAELDPARVEQEMVLLSQRLDVEEELDRLTAHVAEVQRVLTQPEPVGRRLDFLMQELNREANTLGSKSADVETTRIAVELKVLIEQAREQVQNVE